MCEIEIHIGIICSLDSNSIEIVEFDSESEPILKFAKSWKTLKK
jgi:hypothetical protein